MSEPPRTDTLERRTLSGWCSPAALDGLPHPIGHAACEEQIAKGRVVCQCPDHSGDSP